MLSTVCLIAKDEERSIAEWIAYQRVIGFDRVIVYDNGSVDETPRIVHRICRNDDAVSLVSWPRRAGIRPQNSAYADCLERAETEWIAFFDTDEFLVLYRHRSVNDMLASLAAEISAVAVPWRNFGSAGRIEPGDGLVIERFLRCQPDTPPPSIRTCKSIVRRRSVESIDNPHTMTMRAGRYGDASGNPVDILPKGRCTPALLDTAAVNHYAVKSRAEFRAKMNRGNATQRRHPTRKSKAYRQLYWSSKDRNEAVNEDILRHLKDVHARLDRYALAV